MLREWGVEEVALTGAAKAWTLPPGTGRPGTWPPEPSVISSVGGDAAVMGDDGASALLGDDVLTDDDESLPPEGPASPFGRSQTMSRAQSISFALSGARISAQHQPMALGEGA